VKSEPHLRLKNRCRIFFYPISKKILDSSSYSKVMAISLNYLHVRVSKVRYRLGLDIGLGNKDWIIIENAWRGSSKVKKGSKQGLHPN
jgi:hypothetical protein